MSEPIPSAALHPASAGVLHRGSSSEDVRAKLREKAVDYEAVFISQMLQPMFEGLQADAPFGAGNAEDVWRSFQLEEFGKAIARTGGVGLADGIYRQLLAAQETRGE